MEDYTTLLRDSDDSEDALSFCDLPIHSDDSHQHDHQPDPSQDDDFFEFFSEPIIITGRSLPPNTWRSESFDAAAGATAATASSRSLVRSESLRLPVPVSKGSGGQNRPDFSRMRVTSAARSKKHAFMFGLPKFPLEMELSDIKRRQNRRAQAPLVPAAGNKDVAAGGGKRGGKMGHWALLRPFRCRGNLRSALGKAAFGCVSTVL